MRPCAWSGECREGCKGTECKLERRWNEHECKADHVLSWVVPGEPKPKKRGKIGKRRGRSTLIKHPDTAAAEAAFVLQSRAFLPRGLIEGPVEVTLRFVFAPTPSWPKWKKSAALANRIFHVGKPDVDNLSKLVLDALNGELWHDDTQVAALKAVKGYGEQPRTEVHVRRFLQAVS